MDSKITDLKVLKIAKGFSGTLKDFKGSLEMIEICEQQLAIAKSVMPSAMQKNPIGLRERYFNHLCRLAKEFLDSNQAVRSWEDFCQVKGTQKTSKIFFEFGVKAEVFDCIPDEAVKEKAPTRTRVTLEELHELCVIKFNYSGSLRSFQRLITENYGSFAEYCLQKGYDLNQTKWDDREVALRCAARLVSLEAIKARSITLFNYLNDNNLLL